jgi:hypothetical protein
MDDRVVGRLNLSALSIAMSTGSPEAFRELGMLRTLPEFRRTIMRRAAQTRCVILASTGCAALPDHPSAIHVRLRAPLECCIAAYQRENIVDPHRAEKAVKHDDHVKHAWVRTLYGLDINDARKLRAHDRCEPGPVLPHSRDAARRGRRALRNAGDRQQCIGAALELDAPTSRA